MLSVLSAVSLGLLATLGLWALTYATSDGQDDAP